MRAYADFIVRGMGLQGSTHYAQPSPSKTVVITYMARRASTVWPEKVNRLDLALGGYFSILVVSCLMRSGALHRSSALPSYSTI